MGQFPLISAARGAAYDALLWPFERLGLGDLRGRLLSRAHGRVLEIGAGTGLNCRHYPADARVLGVEPNAGLRAWASRRGARVVDGDAQALNFTSGSFDVAVATLVFCSVPDWRAGLREAARVLKPDGVFLLAEHVLPEGAAGVLARAAAPAWATIAAGCRLDRNPAPYLSELGFRIEDSGQFWRGVGRWWVLRK